MTDDDELPPFKIRTKRDSDRVDVKSEENKTVCSIVSPHGFSSAAIERTGDVLPSSLS